MGGGMFLSFQTYGPIPLLKEAEATAFIVKFSGHRLFQRFISHILNKRNPSYSGPIITLK